MEILADSSTPDENLLVLSKEQSNSQTIVPYESSGTMVGLSSEGSKQSISVAPVKEEIVPAQTTFSPHPLIVADREAALLTIQSLLSTALEIKQQLLGKIFEGPVCPYQKTLNEYLGANYKAPAIQDLEYPVDFSVQNAVTTLAEISNKHNDTLLTHLDLMSAEASDTGFVGITSQNLGNAFAVLSTTANGQEFLIDRQKTAKHLEFAEIVRNIPSDYIVQNPLVVAHKLLSHYINIQD